jgi:hypothetical protein
MSTTYRYASVVVDDLAAASDVFERLGTRTTWKGTHPHFRTHAALSATRRGGILLLELAEDAHPAVQKFRNAKERYFNLCLAVADLQAQRSRCAGARHVTSVTDEYLGPAGPSFAVEMSTGGQDTLWVEFVPAAAPPVGHPQSAFSRVESTAMVAPTREALLGPFRELGLDPDAKVSGAYFEVLAAANSVLTLGWHYLEVNEPTGEGAMAGFLKRLGRPGIFGLNLEPVDMGAFVNTAHQESIETNTPTPIVLRLELHGTQMDCADIITVPPRATGGARLFILTPREYPWALLGE